MQDDVSNAFQSVFIEMFINCKKNSFEEKRMDITNVAFSPLGFSSDPDPEIILFPNAPHNDNENAMLI